jgi:hypothetical protein
MLVVLTIFDYLTQPKSGLVGSTLSKFDLLDWDGKLSYD